MAQQLINVGAAANDGTGDKWRAAFVKVNANETQLFNFINAVDVVNVSQESDFPVQDATTITLEQLTEYRITAAFTTAKSFNVQNASVLNSSSSLGPLLTYSGTGSMFNITDANFLIRDIQIDHPNAQGFNCVDTVGGMFHFFSENCRQVNGTKYGTFNNLNAVVIDNSTGINFADGMSFLGSNITFISLDKTVILGNSVSFKGIDLGSAISQVIKFTDCIFAGPPGAFGISGLANNGNVPIGRLAMVLSCEFQSLTDLENITVDDVRWLFRDNLPTQDSFAEALLSLTGNATNTVIAASNTPVIVAGTWVVDDFSHFTVTTAGRVTYTGERDMPSPVTISFDIEPVSGTNKNLKGYVALNGTVITTTGRLARVDSGNPQSITTIWQLTLQTNDFIEFFVENNSDAIDILVSGAVIRVR